MSGINNLLYNKEDKKHIDRMLTSKEVMEHLHIKDRRTYNKLLNDGLPYLKVGKECLTPISEYEKWIKNNLHS